MAKAGEETKPNEVEPSTKVPDGKKPLTVSPTKKPSSPQPKTSGGGSEEKGAGEGSGVPSVVVTPASPPVKASDKKRDEEPTKKKHEEKKDVSPKKTAAAGEGAQTMSTVTTAATSAPTPVPVNEPEPKPTTPPEPKPLTTPEPKPLTTPEPKPVVEQKTETTTAVPPKTKSEAVPAPTTTPKPTPPLPLPVAIDMTSKMSIRMATWNRLEADNFVLFPRPCTDRLPRFKGEVEAVERLAQLDVFKEAKLVKVELDKAHERLRLEIIQSGKALVAGTPGLREAVFLVMHPPMEPSRTASRSAASRIGIHYFGVALDFQAEQADLVILGSVAVDKKGRRIGKGKGFSDLEFALLSKLGTIPPTAVIATLVHDAQVYEEFPESIFKPYDVPVDIIITPTRVIHVEKKLERPTLRWDLLSKRRVDGIPIIKQLLDKEQVNGAKINLKEEDSDTEANRRFVKPQPRRFTKRRRQASAPEPRGQTRSRVRRESSAPPPNRGTRTFRRRPRRQTSTSGDSPKSERQGMVKPGGRRGPIRRINKPRYTVDFSVKVNGLSSAVRIRELKAALCERGVRPSDISWRATKGVALLHFAKRRSAQQEAALAAGKSVNDVVASLQGLSIKPEDGPRIDLSVEVAQPLGSGPKGPPMVSATA